MQLSSFSARGPSPASAPGKPGSPPLSVATKVATKSPAAPSRLISSGVGDKAFKLDAAEAPRGEMLAATSPDGAASA